MEIGFSTVEVIGDLDQQLWCNSGLKPCVKETVRRDKLDIMSICHKKKLRNGAITFPLASYY